MENSGLHCILSCEGNYAQKARNPHMECQSQAAPIEAIATQLFPELQYMPGGQVIEEVHSVVVDSHILF